jgi:ribonuclease P protein component
MSDKSETFRKSERLCSKKAIADLFENGKSFYSFPFQIIWTKTESEIIYPAQVAISVSKRTFRRAVTRNLIRRRIREAYRRDKQILYDFLSSCNTHISFIIIYKDSSVPEYIAVEKAIANSLNKLIADITSKCAIC